MRTGRGLWAEIGASVALLALAVMVLHAGLLWAVANGATTRSAEVLAQQIVVGLGAEIEALERVSATVEGEGVAGPEVGAPASSVVRRVLETYRASVAGEASVGEVAVWDASGALLHGAWSLPPEGRGALASRGVVVGSDDAGAWAVRALGTRRDRLLGVRVGSDAAGMPSLWIVTGVAAGSSCLVAALAIGLFRRRLLIPIERLRATTTAIAAGAFGEQVAFDAPEELRDLGAALNAMSAALAAYRTQTSETVTRLQAANEELRRAQDALVRTERLASVGRLAAGLAHELGNPLAAVRGYVELLSMDAVPRDADMLGRCAGEVERMHVLVRRVLAFARPGVAAVESLHLAAIVVDARESVALAAACLHVDIVVDVAPAVVVQADMGRMHQVFVNLFLNAGAAGATRVLCRAEVEGDIVTIDVEDDGHGIASELLERVFEPFYTTRAPGEGTGLGLALVRRMLDEQGGSVRVMSPRQDGRGACFTIRLPGRVSTPATS